MYLLGNQNFKQLILQQVRKFAFLYYTEFISIPYKLINFSSD